MKIEAVDFFYLSMPVVTDAADGSQDALVVRVAAGGFVGWGECEASPLVSIAAYVCPMSHGACRPVRDSVLGQDLSSPADIARMIMRLQGVARALLPMLKTRQANGYDSITALTNFYTTQFRPLLAEQASVSDLTALLRQALHNTPVSMLRFDAMDPQHPTFSMLHAALRQAGLVPFKFFGFGNWYLEAKNLSWEAYLKQLPGKHRNTLKRLGKKFAEDGGVFKITVGQELGLEQAVQAYQAVYAVSWKVPEPFPDFIPGFIQLCAQRGWLRLGIAYMGEQPVAAQFWLVVHGRACIYKVCYDEQFSVYSPGSLLTGEIMRHVLEVDQVHEVDYLIGDDAYKKTWMSHRRERWGIVAYNPRTLKGALGALREMLARTIKPLLQRMRAVHSTTSHKVAK